MKHLHACGVLHRDLKSDNALVQSLTPLVVKWADFGVSVKLATAVHSAYGPGEIRTMVQQFAWQFADLQFERTCAGRGCRFQMYLCVAPVVRSKSVHEIGCTASLACL